MQEKTTIALLLALIATSAFGYEPPLIDDYRRDYDPALGINETFGRWNTTVRLVYDPDGAPAQYQNESKFLALLDEATQQWERVSGIRFDILPSDPNIRDDAGLFAFQQDKFVRVYWAATGGFAGLAGPEFDDYSDNLGYFPFHDGDVKLNNDPSIWDEDGELVSTLVHELGHLIGLGHSDNPRSVMFANPYNNLRYPREDDIRAVQALYGPGDANLDPARPVSDWLYVVPTTVSSAAQALGNTFVSLPTNITASISTITDSTFDNQFVRVNSGEFNGGLALNATIVLVDPGGYLRSKTAWQLNCPPANFCSGGAVGLVRVDELKTYPGTWRILIVDESQGVLAARLIRSHSLMVATTTDYNRAPMATVTVKDGGASTRVTLTVTATDKENNAIEVIWHPPGVRKDRDFDGFLDNEIAEALGSDGEAVQTIDFVRTGTHTLFVELRDNSVRYDGSRPSSSSSGDGFSNLLRLTLTLPLTPGGGVQTYAIYPLVVTPSPAVITSVGAAQNMASVVTNTGSTTTAAFRLGASKDNGVTTGTSFSTSDNLVIAGTVLPQAADVGKAVEIFTVIRSFTTGGESWSFRDSSGQYRPWPGVRIPDLLPAYESISMPASSAYVVYTGALGPGDHRIFIGYRVKGSNVLHYTGSAMRVLVN